VRFSIFLSLPSVIVSILSSFLSLFKTAIDWSQVLIYLAAFVISVLVGYLSIQSLRIASRKRKLRYFAYYLWAAGLVTVILALTLTH
jgi:undecaprenyl-diphosphatase